MPDKELCSLVFALLGQGFLWCDFFFLAMPWFFHFGIGMFTLCLYIFTVYNLFLILKDLTVKKVGTVNNYGLSVLC